MVDSFTVVNVVRFLGSRKAYLADWTNVFACK